MRRLLLSALLLFLSPVVWAGQGFSFVSDRVKVTVKPDAKLVSMPFEFENKTERPLKIARYDSACSCISARVAGGKLAYQPGEKGKIVVDFELGSFSGEVEKTLMLWTTNDAAEKPSSILTSVITIPVLFEVSPKTLFWDHGGSKESKTIKLKVNSDQPIRILKLAGTNQNYSYELKTVRDGWEYELVVSPQSVESMGMGMIKITTDAAIPRYQRQQAFVCVRKPKK